MNIKLNKLILPTIAIGVLLIPTFHNIAMADSGSHCDHRQISPEKMQEQMKARLNKLAERLEIKSSQQAVWEEFVNSVGTLTEQGVKTPGEDADAATVARYRAERANDVAKKLTGIADATATLQKVLTEDQRKIFNQESHRFLHKEPGWGDRNHEQGGESHDWKQRSDARHDAGRS